MNIFNFTESLFDICSGNQIKRYGKFSGFTRKIGTPDLKLDFDAVNSLMSEILMFLDF